MKKGRHYELPVTTIQKLEAYEISSHIKKNKIVELAIESYIISDVDVENMTEIEVKKMYGALIDKKQQLEEQIMRVYLRLED